MLNTRKDAVYTNELIEHIALLKQQCKALIQSKQTLQEEQKKLLQHRQHLFVRQQELLVDMRHYRQTIVGIIQDSQRMIAATLEQIKKKEL